MIKSIKNVMLCAIVVVSCSSQAGLIDYNDTVANTYQDTTTGLVWLDNRMTGWYSGYSSSYSSGGSSNYNTVAESILNFSDFRMAKASEVKALIENAFTNLTFDSNGEYDYYDSWSRSAGGDRSVQDPLFSTDFTNLLSVAGGSTYRYSASRSDGDSWGTTRIDGIFDAGDGTFGCRGRRARRD